MTSIKKITIVGGGTSGWIAAAVLANSLPRDQVSIELVETEEIESLGVGESTIPPFLNLIRKLDIPEKEFIKATEATYKLGIKFVNWHRNRDFYFHPFGAIGSPIEGHEFYQCWSRAREQDRSLSLQDFSPCSVMATKGKFFFPQYARNTPIGGANYALHVDAQKVSAYLANYAKSRGVKHTLGRVQQVQQKDNGFISHLILDDGRVVHGDFFIDCSGFKSILLGESLKVDFVDWSKYLPCDRAVAIKTKPDGSPPPFTCATAQKAGWSWRIPLANAVGHGYVYASEFCTDQQAKSTLLRSLSAETISDSRTIKFRCGYHRESWRHNCLSLGLASGFIEPLEATAIHLITRGLNFFLRYYPDENCHPALIREFNRCMSADFEEVRDFVILHYATSSRSDSPFWRWWQTSILPDSLQQRMELFVAQGATRLGIDDLFRASSWQSVFEGMGVRPNRYCARIDNLSLKQIQQELTTAKRAIFGMVDALPNHEDFLAQMTE
jgi:tryptophan halogenase